MAAAFASRASLRVVGSANGSSSWASGSVEPTEAIAVGVPAAASMGCSRVKGLSVSLRLSPSACMRAASSAIGVVMSSFRWLLREMGVGALERLSVEEGVDLLVVEGDQPGDRLQPAGGKVVGP